MSDVCVVGSFMMDLVARAPRRPHVGETLLGHSFETHLGGKGFNQAIAARRYGADVEFVGMLGSDAFGDQFAAALDANGILRSKVARHKDVGTGVGLPVVEDSGENSIIIIPQANNRLTGADIRAARQTISNARVLVMQMELSLEATLEAARVAHEADTTVVLNPAPFAPLPDSLLRNVDLLVMNEVEAREFVGVTESTIEELVARCREAWSRPLVITLGEDGVVIVEDGTVTTRPSHKVVAVDTVGAGDTFCGVLAAGLADGKSLLESAVAANAAAAIAVTRSGSSTAIPLRAEIDEFIANAQVAHR